MKVALIGYFHGFGGAEKQMSLLASELAKRNHDVILVAISVNKEVYHIDNNIKKYYIKDRSKYKIINIINRFIELRKILIKEKPQISINFWLQSAYLIAMMNKRKVGRLLYSERCDPGDSEYDGMLGLIRRIAFKRVDAFVFQTAAARDYFPETIRRKSVVIPNPVFVRDAALTSFDRREKRIVCVGRLHEQKNLKLLINSFSQIKDKYDKFILQIYGDGDQKEELQVMIDGLGLSERIKLMGTYDDIHERIKNARLFVLCSNYEGMPNALLEAMALGLPCISTDWAPGGVHDIIDSHNNGVIVPVNNEKELARAMGELLSNDKESSMIGINAKNSMKKYSHTVIFEKWENYIKKVVNRK